MWSAWLCVNRIASTRVNPKRSACARRSVDVSTSTWSPSSNWTRIDGRQRRSRGSSDRHVAHSQPIIGTPCDVPVPRKVMRTTA